MLFHQTLVSTLESLLQAGVSLKTGPSIVDYRFLGPEDGTFTIAAS
jgi:hypothetical protein